MLPSLSRLAFAAFLLTTSLGGCSLVLDADEPQCKVDADCTKRGSAEAKCVASLCVLSTAAGGAGGAGGDGAAGTTGDAGAGGTEAAGGSAGAPLEPPWTCIGTVPTPVGTTPKAHVKLPLVDFITGAPRPNVSVRVCGQLDPQCDATSATNPSFVSGPDGVVTLEIPAQPTAFNGYFRIDGTPEVAPSIIFAQPLTVTEGATLSPVKTFVLAQYRALVEAGGNVWNDARGHIFVQARNCDDQPAEGVTYAIPKLEADTVRVFLREGSPDRTALDTDATGIGGFIMAGEGFHVVTGTLSKTGTVVNERRVRVEPGTFTYTVMSPSP